MVGVQEPAGNLNGSLIAGFETSTRSRAKAAARPKPKPNGKAKLVPQSGPQPKIQKIPGIRRDGTIKKKPGPRKKTQPFKPPLDPKDRVRKRKEGPKNMCHECKLHVAIFGREDGVRRWCRGCALNHDDANDLTCARTPHAPPPACRTRGVHRLC